MFPSSKQLQYHILILLMSVAVLMCTSNAFALFQFDDDYQSPATLALQFKKTQMSWADTRLGYFDGLITNNQTEIKHYDRRMAVGFGAGIELPTASNVSFRFDVRGESVLRRQLDNAQPETYIDERYVYVKPTTDLTYITPAGLELFVGASWTVVPAYSQKIDSQYDSTTVKYGSTSILAPHVGLTRRGGSGAGGLYYQFGKQEKRSVQKSASDGTVLDISQEIQEPSTLGVFASFAGTGVVWTFDLAAVSEGEGGDRTESGNTMRDDNLRLSVSSLWSGSLKAGLSHRTARYAKSAYMDLDSIPITSGKILWLWTGANAGLYSGVVAAYGRDKQSIPEVNARYEVNAISLTTGVTGAF